MIFLNKPGKNKTSDSYIRSHYYLYDKFTTDRAAGAVHNTQAEPVGGARIVVDTNSKISIANGVATFATGAASNDGIWWPFHARVLGKTFMYYVVPSATTNQFSCGLSSASSALITNRLTFLPAGYLPHLV